MVRLLFVAAVFGAISSTQVFAQGDGSRCVTDEGWCWASPPGNPGDPCECPHPSGSGVITGVLR